MSKNNKANLYVRTSFLRNICQNQKYKTYHGGAVIVGTVMSGIRPKLVGTFTLVAVIATIFGWKGIIPAIAIGLFVSYYVTDPIKKLTNSAKRLAAGDTDVSINCSTKGEAGDLAESVSKMAQKVAWSQAIIDAIPFPVHVIDMDMNWAFMNKSFEKLMVEKGVINSRKDCVGMPCCSADANICNTDSCGIRQLHKGVGESFFDWCGMKCKQDTSYLLDANGNKIGYVETVTDLTSILDVQDYTKLETTRMAANLDQLAQGNLDFDLTVNTANENTQEVSQQFVNINESLAKVKTAISNMVEDANSLTKAANEENFDVRADGSRHQGAYRNIIEELNSTMDKVVDKVVWYEGILDGVPFPVHAIDMNMNWTFLNKAFEKLMIDGGHIKNRKEAVGMPCCTASANICNTEGCGIKQLLKGNAESFFDWCGMKCKQDTGYMFNKRGEKIGYVETVTDLTSVLEVEEYNKSEVERVAANLDQLAEGNFNFNMNIKETNKYTEETSKNFVKINNNLEKVRNSIKTTIEDAKKLADAADNGNLEARADASKYSGEYNDLIVGINGMLDAVAIPFQRAIGQIENVSKGIIPEQITKEYKGDFKKLGDSFNSLFKTLSGLVLDIEQLVNAALEGRLTTRADASKHPGEFRKVVQGVNDTLDAVIDPIKESFYVLEKLANNDLTARMEGDYKGDHAKIKNSLNSAMDTLENTIKKVTDSSEKVAMSSSTLSSTASEVGKGVQQITETISQVATGSQEQSKTVMASTSAMEQLSRAIEEVATGAQTQAKTVDETVALVQQITSAIDQVVGSAKNAAETSQHVSEVATSGGQQVADAVGSMDRIKVATDKVADMVKKLGESSQQIGAIVETIDDIAEQTNLLALNAAIEAARAGEHGKGFAVVADEVRKLAERSSKATGEIADLIGGIRQMTELAVDAMEKGSKEVADGTALGKNAGEALKHIEDAVASVVQQAQDVSSAAVQMSSSSSEIIRAIENVSAITEQSTAAAQQMAASSNEVSQQIEQVAALSEENSASAQEVSATTEEQNASVEEMTASADELAQMARNLQDLVEQFNVDNDEKVTQINKRRKAA